jgi:energy-coupling factor transporter ATP-binding protein EcfA2
MDNINAITRVEIEDFLVFKGKFAADFCPGVNVLIGGNGTGKTTLMKVLSSALASEKDVAANKTQEQQSKQVRGYGFIPMRSVSWREIAPPSTNSSPVRLIMLSVISTYGKKAIAWLRMFPMTMFR